MRMSSSPHHSPAVVVPTYNNAGTLANVLDRILALALPIIVVNDGSTDATADLLASWSAGARPSDTPIHLLAHNRNLGKAAALRTGFARAAHLGFSHAVTIDSDLQHDPEEIPLLLERSRAMPDALVIGSRRDDLAGTPRRSLIGRRLSNGAIYLASGVRVSDSQSGMRVYPLRLVEAAVCRSGHFSYETEIIVQAAWCGHPISEAPITSRYLPPHQRVSHFRPYVDSLRCLRMHARLLPRVPWRRVVRGAAGLRPMFVAKRRIV